MHWQSHGAKYMRQLFSDPEQQVIQTVNSAWGTLWSVRGRERKSKQSMTASLALLS